MADESVGSKKKLSHHTIRPIGVRIIHWQKRPLQVVKTPIDSKVTPLAAKTCMGSKETHGQLGKVIGKNLKTQGRNQGFERTRGINGRFTVPKMAGTKQL